MRYQLCGGLEHSDVLHLHVGKAVSGLVLLWCNLLCDLFSLIQPLSLFSRSADMPLHVRRSSDPSLSGLPLGEVSVRPEELSRTNPAHWSTTTGSEKNKPNTSAGTGSLDRKVKHRSVDDTLVTCHVLPQMIFDCCQETH